MKIEVRTTVIVSIIMIGMLTTAGIISYMIIKHRRKGMDELETDQGSMKVNVNSKPHQKQMSTRSRHRKERGNLPINSRRIRFSKSQGSGQQSQ